MRFAAIGISSLTCTGEKNGNGTRVTSPAATYGASTASKSADTVHRR